MPYSTQTTGKVHFIIVNFIRLLLLAAIIGSYFTNRQLVFTVAIIALILTFIPSILSKRYNIQVPAELEFMVIIFIYGSLFLGEVRGFYAEFWWWDVLLNLFSALALGFVGLTILTVLQKDEKIDASPLMISILAFCFAFAFASMWEIFEFTLDQFLASNLQKSLFDTMTDLTTAAVGAVMVSITGYFYLRSGRTNILSGIIIKIIQKHPKIFKAKQDPIKEIQKLINQNESETLEFKSTLRVNAHTNQIDKNIELTILKTMVAFLNSKGGTLLIGISNDGQITGIEKDNFENNDRALLHLTNLIKTHISDSLSQFITKEIINIDNKNIIKINCKQSNRRIFLRIGKEEIFYIRNGPSSIKLEGNALLDYVEHKFKDY